MVSQCGDAGLSVGLQGNCDACFPWTAPDAPSGFSERAPAYQLTADSEVDKEGNVYFTDARKNRILKIDLEGKIRLERRDQWHAPRRVGPGWPACAFPPIGRCS